MKKLKKFFKELCQAMESHPEMYMEYYYPDFAYIYR